MITRPACLRVGGRIWRTGKHISSHHAHLPVLLATLHRWSLVEMLIYSAYTTDTVPPVRVPRPSLYDERYSFPHLPSVPGSLPHATVPPPPPGPPVPHQHRMSHPSLGQDDQSSPDQPVLSHDMNERLSRWREAAANAPRPAIPLPNGPVASAPPPADPMISNPPGLLLPRADRLAQNQRMHRPRHTGSAGSITIQGTSISIETLSNEIAHAIHQVLPSYHSATGSREIVLDPTVDPGGQPRSVAPQPRVPAIDAGPDDAVTGGNGRRGQRPAGGSFRFPNPPPSHQLPPHMRADSLAAVRRSDPGPLHAPHIEMPGRGQPDAPIGSANPQRPSGNTNAPLPLRDLYRPPVAPVDPGQLRSALSTTAGIQDIAERVARNLSIQRAPLDRPNIARRLTEEIRNHIREHPELGLEITPPRDMDGHAANPARSVVTAAVQAGHRGEGGLGSPAPVAVPRISTNKSASEKQVYPKATVETVYSGSENGPSPPRDDKKSDGAENGKKGPLRLRDGHGTSPRPDEKNDTLRLSGTTKSGNKQSRKPKGDNGMVDEEGWLDIGCTTALRKLASIKLPRDKQGIGHEDHEERDAKRDATTKSKVKGHERNQSSGDHEIVMTPHRQTAEMSGGVKATIADDSRHDPKKHSRSGRKDGHGDSEDGSVLEIPRTTPPSTREQPQIVSYTYVGNPARRSRHHRDISSDAYAHFDLGDIALELPASVKLQTHRRAPPGESYSHTSTTVRQGGSGGMRWRIEDTKVESCDRRSDPQGRLSSSTGSGHGPLGTSKTKTRTVMTEHTDVFGQIIRSENRSSISTSQGHESGRHGHGTGQRVRHGSSAVRLVSGSETINSREYRSGAVPMPLSLLMSPPAPWEEFSQSQPRAREKKEKRGKEQVPMEGRYPTMPRTRPKSWYA